MSCFSGCVFCNFLALKGMGLKLVSSASHQSHQPAAMQRWCCSGDMFKWLLDLFKANVAHADASAQAGGALADASAQAGGALADASAQSAQAGGALDDASACEEGALPALPDDDSPPFLPRPMDPSLARMYEELTIDSTPYHHLMLDPRNRVLSFNRRP